MLPTRSGTGSHMAFLNNLISTNVVHPMTFDPINGLHFGQGFFLSSLIALRHSWAIWPRMTPYDLWPQQCITLQSGVLPTTFGAHRVYLQSNFTSGWRMTFGGLAPKIRSWAGGFMPFLHAKFHSHTSKHDEKHSRTHPHTPTHPDTKAPLF